ncbi:ABC transporter ATP-binding protein [Leifsonia shinshuensis]|uniref:Putative ABC transport system ATP-binding protein n=1 Tax=Leifsonia shinshuensis TaxID=150026 RepID=A0A853CXL0_9MICO|nr:ABC transporter ATP-binding protein [Leifsonia shinshuensis]NYJ25357.1 putative ABC transport system ATP-binding protein [Leifsonia shinshuensis]
MTSVDTVTDRAEAVPEGPLLVADGVSRVFDTAAGPVVALAEASLEVHAGELVVIKGRSGSGKTTLLNVLSGLDRPTSGTVVVNGVEVATADEAALVRLRQRDVGFVFQSFGLIPVLSAAENVELPLRLLGTEPMERDARVAELLDRVGLAAHARQRPTELSGGQQQRVGIARALAADPPLLFADEPTGQLDSVTGRQIMDLLVDLVHGGGVAAVVTTHDPLLMARADRVLELHDGRLGHAARRRGRHSAEG